MNESVHKKYSLSLGDPDSRFSAFEKGKAIPFSFRGPSLARVPFHPGVILPPTSTRVPAMNSKAIYPADMPTAPVLEGFYLCDCITGKEFLVWKDYGSPALRR